MEGRGEEKERGGRVFTQICPFENQGDRAMTWHYMTTDQHVWHSHVKCRTIVISIITVTNTPIISICIHL